MSISSTTARNNYTGNGSTETYAYGFRILDDDHLLVTVRDSVGVETTLVKTTDYTVTSVGVGAGGNVVLVDAGQDWIDGSGYLDSGWTLSIRREVPLTQPTDIRNQGTFYPETHEDALDRSVMQMQSIYDELSRGIRLPETVDPSTFDPEIPAAVVGEAGAILQVNSTGDGWTVGASTVVGATVSPYMETVLDDLTAADARTTLGFSGASGTVATANIEALAVTAAKIANTTITATQLASNAVTTAKITDANVTAAKLAEAVYDIVDVYAGASSGGSDTYAVAPSPAFTSYVTGMKLSFKADVANTGAATLNVNSLGAKNLKVFAGGAVADPLDNLISANSMVTVQYDGTQFIILSTGLSIGERLVSVSSPSAASSLALTGLTAGTRYKLVANLLQNTSDGELRFRFNNDSGANYMRSAWFTSAGGNFSYDGAATYGLISGGGTVKTGEQCILTMEFQAMPGTLTKCQAMGKSASYRGTSNDEVISDFSAKYTGGANITEVDLYPSAGTFTGTVLLYALGA